MRASLADAKIVEYCSLLLEPECPYSFNTIELSDVNRHHMRRNRAGGGRTA
jgi:hypothetical protein